MLLLWKAMAHLVAIASMDAAPHQALSPPFGDPEYSSSMIKTTLREMDRADLAHHRVFSTPARRMIGAIRRVQLEPIKVPATTLYLQVCWLPVQLSPPLT
jgi:hypothetical protein